MAKQSGLTEMVKYGTVGAISTIIDMGILNIAKVYFGWPVWLAVGIGFVSGTVNGYFMNSRWTFNYDTKGQESKKFSQFAIVSIIGLGLTEVIVNGYIGLVGADFSIVGRNISETNVGKLIAVAIVFFWNYFANKLWTFNSSNGK